MIHQKGGKTVKLGGGYLTCTSYRGFREGRNLGPSLDEPKPHGGEELADG